MSDLSRRSLLGASAALASAMGAPVAAASSDPLERRAGELRRGWASKESELVLSLIPDGRFPAGDPIVDGTRELARGLSAVDLVKELQELGPEEQVHPAMQTLIVDAAESFGRTLLRCRELVGATLSLDDAEQDRELQLRGALRTLRVSLRDWRLDPQRARMLDETLASVEADTRPRVLGRRSRKVMQRIDRARRLVHDALLTDAPLELLARPEPEQEARALAGIRSLGARPVADSGAAASGALIVGLLLLGAAGIGGFVMLGYGACMVSCGEPEGVLLVLLGLAVIGLCIWGGGVLVYRLIQIQEANSDEEQAAAPPDAVNVHPQDAWVQSQLVAEGASLRLRARGRVKGPWGWLASPDGDGVAAGHGAPMPGAPEAALIARVADRLFFLGADGELPAGLHGPVELTLNIEPEHRERALGFFHVVRLS